MKRRFIFTGKRAFTLVELLMAMAISLLLMAALAKAFAVIGESMKSGRSRVALSSKLRGISFRLRNDLQSRTVDASPPIKSESGNGYFMYYEGPLTEHTFGLFGACPQRRLPDGTVVFPYMPRDTNANSPDPRFHDKDAGPTYRRHSRFGDFDDYIAFTAEAPDGEWFTGKVPAYLIDSNAADPMEPRLIRSKYAEIIIWASPKWDVDAASNSLNLPTDPLSTAMPLYQDNNNDLVPDNVVLHQRVLLIRPDLNVRSSITWGSLDPFVSDVMRPQGLAVPVGPPDPTTVNPWVVPAALQSIYPIGIPNPTTGSPPPVRYPNYVHPSSDTDNREVLQSNWLVGMTPLHHFFDLSLRRVFHPVTGDPTGYVAANSLKDLVQPHNRFAHVRYPGRYFNRGTFGGGDFATSMPLLAVGWNDTLLTWQGAADPRALSPTTNQPSWFPTGHPSARSFNFASGSEIGLFNGWLLPHFELGDPNPVGSSTAGNWQRGYLITPDARWDRTGEDVIAANIVAFDVKGFDRTAPVFVTAGRDGQPGFAGVNDDLSPDDGSGDTDSSFTIPPTFTEVSTELGTIGSDDETVGVGDLGVFPLLNLEILNPSNPASFANRTATTYDRQALATRGAFVDLMYPYLAGSASLNLTTYVLNTTTDPTNPFDPRYPYSVSTPPPTVAVQKDQQVFDNYQFFIKSELSSFPIPAPSPIPGDNEMNSLKRSGRLVHRSLTNGSIYFMQPVYDTFTDAYETDGFDQTHTEAGQVTGAFEVGTTWVLNTSPSGLSAGPTPRLTAPVGDSIQIDTGLLTPDDPETSAPFQVDLPAVSVSVRVVDPQTDEVTEFTVVEELQ